jgi:glucose-1-phosphate thymidylyltransferase
MTRQLPQPLRQLIFTCAGKGTRLSGETGSTLPKPLTEIAGEPIISRLIRQYQSVHKGPGPIVIVAPGDELTPKLTRALVGSRAIVVEQARPDGVANAILLALPHLVGDALVLLGDIVLEGTLSDPPSSSSAVYIWDEAPPEATRENFGVLVDNGRVAELVEKPAEPRGLKCGIGVYALTRDCVAKFADVPINPMSGERGITEALQYVNRHGFPLHALHFSGAYINVNRLVDRARAEEVLRSLARRGQKDTHGPSAT